MSTDAQLKTAVMEALEWEPTVTAEDITVVAENGIVTLSGSVPYFVEKCSAERATQHVTGVKAIVEQLVVNISGMHQRTDLDLAKAVVDTLSWNVWVPDEVVATIADGWVTLTGEISLSYQRNAAGDCLKHLIGVKGILNLITLKTNVPTAPITHAIETVLKRNAEIDAEHITVVSEGSKVTLTGKVRSWSERGEAGVVAWGTSGVTEVENQLVVSA